MRRVLLGVLAACTATLAHANTVTLSTGVSCAYETITTSASGNVSVACAKSDTPTTPPVTPPTTPPVGTGCPMVPGVLQPLLIDPVAGQNRQVYAKMGEVWSGPLPPGKLQGGFISSDFTGTPPMTIEWSLSPCQGDVSFYTAGAGTGLGVCGRTAGTQSGGITWNTNPPPRNPACKIDTTRQWYVNYRILGGCAESQWINGVGCPINYQWN